MARVYMAYGKYDKAQPLAEQAVNFAQNANLSDEQLCMSMLDLAYVYEKQAKLAQAEELCTLGIKLQEKIYYKHHPHIAYSLRILNSIHRQQGRYDLAADDLDNAMTIILKCHQPDDHIVASFVVDIADLLAARGEYESAQKRYDEALVVISKKYGTDHLYTANVRGRVANLYLARKQYTEAAELIEQTLAIQQKIYGNESHLLIPAWLTMAQLAQEKQDYVTCEQLLKKAYDVIEKKNRQRHPSAGKILSRLGQLYIETGRYDLAETTSKESLTILEGSLGPENDHTAIACDNLAKVYIHQKKYNQAHELCIRALGTLEKIFDAGHPKVKTAKLTMAQLQQKAGNVLGIAKVSQPAQTVPGPDVFNLVTIETTK